MPTYKNLSCSNCKQDFKRATNQCRNTSFCSRNCYKQSKIKTLTLVCCECQSTIIKRPCEVNKSKSKNLFCSRKCAACYNNKNKSTGTRISKLENWLQLKLNTLYPSIDFHFNRKDTINSELDIFIPELKLAFELNGIFHYEPIYSKEKLSQIQNNDSRKFQACLEQGIELCIIDSSKQKYFSEKSSQKYLDIIVNIIDSKSDARRTRTDNHSLDRGTL